MSDGRIGRSLASIPQRPGEVSGALGEEQLSWLRQRLEVTQQLDTLLFHASSTHFRPQSLAGTGLVSRMPLNWKLVLNDFPQVRLIGCGHVHHEVVAQIRAQRPYSPRPQSVQGSGLAPNN